MYSLRLFVSKKRNRKKMLKKAVLLGRTWSTLMKNVMSFCDEAK